MFIKEHFIKTRKSSHKLMELTLPPPLINRLIHHYFKTKIERQNKYFDTKWGTYVCTCSVANMGKFSSCILHKLALGVEGQLVLRMNDNLSALLK